jgi:NAD(P)-dependent dehydrogenase (short-subunit alcohol dehydrogenase family)
LSSGISSRPFGYGTFIGPVVGQADIMTTTLITGATRGLGRETARRLVAAGHTVYLGARDPEQGAAVAADLGAQAVTLDVTDQASVDAAVGFLSTRVGALDVLVNNAGIAGEQRPPAEASIEDLQRVFATNVIGATRVLKALTPQLDASASPVVVQVSSAVGSFGRNSAPDAHWSMLGYPMSKAALNMLTIQWARAFPRWRVNSVTPGLTATGFAPAAKNGVRVAEGAEVIVRMAQIGTTGPTGGFFDVTGNVPW